MKIKGKFERFIEFLLFGLVLGITEDLIAIKLVTGESFTLEMFFIVFAVTVPFAAFSELVVDSEEFKITENISRKIKDLKEY